jgi:hypothetical protein
MNVGANAAMPLVGSAQSGQNPKHAFAEQLLNSRGLGGLVTAMDSGMNQYYANNNRSSSGVYPNGTANPNGSANPTGMSVGAAASDQFLQDNGVIDSQEENAEERQRKRKKNVQRTRLLMELSAEEYLMDPTMLASLSARGVNTSTMLTKKMMDERWMQKVLGRDVGESSSSSSSSSSEDGQKKEVSEK